MSFWDVFFEDGNVNTVIAPPKKGKTNAIVDMCYHAIDHDYTILSNIMFYDEDDIEEAKELGWLNPSTKYHLQPELFKTLPTASELLLASVYTRKGIVVVDEAGITASSYKAQSYSSVQMRFLGFTIRKLGSCLIVIAQSKSSVVPDLREHLTTFEVRVIRERDDSRALNILKANHYFNTEKQDYDVEMIPYEKLRNVPPTTVAYDTRHPGGFKWDIDLKQLYDTIAERKISSIKIRKQLPSIIREMVAEKKIIEFMKKPQFLQSGKVAKIFGVSSQAVRNWAEEGILPGEQNEKGRWFFHIDDVKKLVIEKKVF